MLIVLFCPLILFAQETGQLYGHVQTVGADREPLYLVGARVVVTSTTDPSVRFETLSDATGAYSFKDVPAGAYTLTATLEGYEEEEESIRIASGVLQEVTLVLKLKAVRAEVEVTAEAPGLQTDQTSPQAEIKGDTLINAPLVSERFQEALPLVPGVVRGQDGLIKIKGARSTQTGWLVNSANVTDPVTGEQAINLPVDVIQDVEVLPNPYDAQYGKFAGAVTTVETRPASDKWKFNLQNFVPRLRRRAGDIRGIESSTPRFTLTGPLVKERLSLLQSFEYRFVRSPVTSLPELEQDTELESFDSFTQLDFSFTSGHTLTTVLSFYPQKNRFANLDTFSPQPTTANYRQRGWMAGVQDRYLFVDGSLLETTLSVKDFDVDVFPAFPGPAFILRPERNFGSFFNSQNRVSRRSEWLELYNFRPRQAGGQHLLKLGLGISRNTFRGFHQSKTVEIRRADGTLAERIDFIGSPLIDRDKTEFTIFLQDKWNVSQRLTADLGLRYDYDTLAHENNFAPRLGLAYVLTDDNKTLLRAGAGLFYDKVPINVGTFTQLQERVVTRFAADGVTLLEGPLTFANRLRDIKTPRSLAFNLELDREIAPGLLLRLGYLQREGRREYLVNPFNNLDGRPALLLEAGGRSRYWETQITLNYHFQEDSFLNASYVHSQTTGNLNNLQEFFGNFENPVIRPDERSRLRFDAPDRILVWGEIELLWGVRWAPVLDVHSGFPFSLVDETQNFVGARNQGGRLPVFASFDSQVWKDFSIKFRGKKRRVRVGIKIFNIFDHFNPRDVQQNLAAPNALGLFNSRGRLFRGKFSIDY